MFFKNKFILTKISLLFIFSLIKTTKRELIFVIDKNSDEENVVIDMIRKINKQEENLIESVYVVFYTCGNDFKPMFYYDIFKNFIGLEDNKIQNEYQTARNISKYKDLHGFYFSASKKKKEIRSDYMWVIRNDFYESLLKLDIIKYQDNRIPNTIIYQLNKIIDLVVNYNTQVNIIITSENKKQLNLRKRKLDLLNLESPSLNHTNGLDNNKVSALYTLIIERKFIISYDSEYLRLMEKIFLKIKNINRKTQEDASDFLNIWLYEQKSIEPAKLVFLLLFVIFEIQNDLILQNIDNRSKSDESIKSLFYNECFELKPPFENFNKNHSRTIDLLKKAGIIIMINEENKPNEYFNRLRNCLKIYNNEEILNIIITCFLQIELESVYKLEKTEVECLFTNFPFLFFENYSFSLKTSLEYLLLFALRMKQFLKIWLFNILSFKIEN